MTEDTAPGSGAPPACGEPRAPAALATLGLTVLGRGKIQAHGNRFTHCFVALRTDGGFAAGHRLCGIQVRDHRRPPPPWALPQAIADLTPEARDELLSLGFREGAI